MGLATLMLSVVFGRMSWHQAGTMAGTERWNDPLIGVMLAQLERRLNGAGPQPPHATTPDPEAEEEEGAGRGSPGPDCDDASPKSGTGRNQGVGGRYPPLPPRAATLAAPLALRAGQTRDYGRDSERWAAMS